MKKEKNKSVVIHIFKVVGWLTIKGFDKRIHELEVIETAQSFIAEHRRISKNKLLAINTVLMENHKNLRYHTYCMECDQQKALDLIKQHIIDKVLTYKSEIDSLVKYLP